jgi:hypothetical protein
MVSIEFKWKDIFIFLFAGDTNLLNFCSWEVKNYGLLIQGFSGDYNEYFGINTGAVSRLPSYLLLHNNVINKNIPI